MRAKPHENLPLPYVMFPLIVACLFNIDTFYIMCGHHHQHVTLHLRSSLISKICYSFFLYNWVICYSERWGLTWSPSWVLQACWCRSFAWPDRSQDRAASTAWSSCCRTIRKEERVWLEISLCETIYLWALAYLFFKVFEFSLKALDLWIRDSQTVYKT